MAVAGCADRCNGGIKFGPRKAEHQQHFPRVSLFRNSCAKTGTAS